VYLLPAVVITTQLLSSPSAHDPNLGRGDLPTTAARPLGPGVEVV